MWKIATKRLVAASVSALALFVFPAPQDPDFSEGIAGLSQAYAAGGKGGHESGGSGGGHELDGHDQTTDSHDHETDGHDDGGHEASGAKGKGPAYRGGRNGSSKGRSGPSRTVVEKIFEKD